MTQEQPVPTSPKAATRFLASFIKRQVVKVYKERTGIYLETHQFDEAYRATDCDEEVVIYPTCRAFYIRIRIDTVDQEYMLKKLSPEERAEIERELRAENALERLFNTIFGRAN